MKGEEIIAYLRSLPGDEAVLQLTHNGHSTDTDLARQVDGFNINVLYTYDSYIEMWTKNGTTETHFYLLTEDEIYDLYLSDIRILDSD